MVLSSQTYCMLHHYLYRSNFYPIEGTDGHPSFSNSCRAAAALLSCKASLLGTWYSHSRQQLHATAAANRGSPSASKAAAAAGQGVHNSSQWPIVSSADGGSASSAEEDNVSSTATSGSDAASEEGLRPDPDSSRAGHRQAGSGAHGSTASSEGTSGSQADESGSSRGEEHVADEEATSGEAAASQEDSLLAGSEAAESGSNAGQDSDVSMADAEAAGAAAAVGAADSEGDLAEPGLLDMADSVLQGLLHDVQLACQLAKLALPGQCADGESLRCVAVQLHVMWCMLVGIKTQNTATESSDIASKPGAEIFNGMPSVGLAPLPAVPHV